MISHPTPFPPPPPPPEKLHLCCCFAIEAFFSSQHSTPVPPPLFLTYTFTLKRIFFLLYSLTTFFVFIDLKKPFSFYLHPTPTPPPPHSHFLLRAGERENVVFFFAWDFFYRLLSFLFYSRAHACFWAMFIYVYTFSFPLLLGRLE